MDKTGYHFRFRSANFRKRGNLLRAMLAELGSRWPNATEREVFCADDCHDIIARVDGEEVGRFRALVRERHDRAPMIHYTFRDI